MARQQAAGYTAIDADTVEERFGDSGCSRATRTSPISRI